MAYISIYQRITPQFRKLIFCLSLIGFIACTSLNSEERLVSNTIHKGDSIFQSHQNDKQFEFIELYNEVHIGNIIHEKAKYGLIFQQIDKKNWLNEIKFICYERDQIIEKVIDTLEMGIYTLEFVDKNRDGYKDLLIRNGGNRITDFIYVFDTLNNTLKQVPGFEDYSSTEFLKGTKLLYSYMAIGCADFYWESRLIKIEDFKIIELGRLTGDRCDEDKKNWRITIQLSSQKEKILPYIETLEPYPNGKFDFIKAYWVKY